MTEANDTPTYRMYQREAIVIEPQPGTDKWQMRLTIELLETGYPTLESVKRNSWRFIKQQKDACGRVPRCYVDLTGEHLSYLPGEIGWTAEPYSKRPAD
jgi:hypothetical protein